MTARNMATITALERSLQNCSLSRSNSVNGVDENSETSDAAENLLNEETTLDLNSEIALPYQWEQCLDLKTGEIYYVNWRNGTKAKEDPRKTANFDGEYYSEEDSSCESESSSSDSSSPSLSSKKNFHYEGDHDHDHDHVLVVAGCKTCLMYFMVPKGVEECPKCSGLILHLDRSENEFP